MSLRWVNCSVRGWFLEEVELLILFFGELCGEVGSVCGRVRLGFLVKVVFVGRWVLVLLVVSCLKILF